MVDSFEKPGDERSKSDAQTRTQGVFAQCPRVSSRASAIIGTYHIIKRISAFWDEFCTISSREESTTAIDDDKKLLFL